MRLIHYVLIVGVIGFIIALGFAVDRIETKKDNFRDNCAPTELFIVNSHFRVTRVYDCGNLSEELE